MEDLPTVSGEVRDKMKDYSDKLKHKVDTENLRTMLREVNESNIIIDFLNQISSFAHWLFNRSVRFVWEKRAKKDTIFHVDHQCKQMMMHQLTRYL